MGPGTLPQAPFFGEKNWFLVLERCRRRFFFVKKCVFSPGTLPQAPFFHGKLRFWSRNVAAGAFVFKNDGKCEPPPKNYLFNCVPEKYSVMVNVFFFSLNKRRLRQRSGTKNAFFHQ